MQKFQSALPRGIANPTRIFTMRGTRATLLEAAVAPAPPRPVVPAFDPSSLGQKVFSLKHSQLKALVHLEPGDPVSVLGNQPLVNVVETVANYTLGQNDAIVIAGLGGLTLTLNASPLTATPVLLIADTGILTVVAPFQSGASISIPQGGMALASYSPLSGLWNVLGSGSGGSSANPPVILIPGSNYFVKPADDFIEAPVSGGKCLVTLPGGTGSPFTPVVNKVYTFKNTTNDSTHALGITSTPNPIEITNSPGNTTTSEMDTVGQGFGFQVKWDGTTWWVISRGG